MDAEYELTPIINRHAEIRITDDSIQIKNRGYGQKRIPLQNVDSVTTKRYRLTSFGIMVSILLFASSIALYVLEMLQSYVPSTAFLALAGFAVLWLATEIVLSQKFGTLVIESYTDNITVNSERKELNLMVNNIEREI